MDEIFYAVDPQGTVYREQYICLSSPSNSDDGLFNIKYALIDPGFIPSPDKAFTFNLRQICAAGEQGRDLGWQNPRRRPLCFNKFYSQGMKTQSASNEGGPSWLVLEASVDLGPEHDRVNDRIRAGELNLRTDLVRQDFSFDDFLSSVENADRFLNCVRSRSYFMNVSLRHKPKAQIGFASPAEIFTGAISLIGRRAFAQWSVSHHIPIITHDITRTDEGEVSSKIYMALDDTNKTDARCMSPYGDPGALFSLMQAKRFLTGRHPMGLNETRRAAQLINQQQENYDLVPLSEVQRPPIPAAA